jgi:hypothetical protein
MAAFSDPSKPEGPETEVESPRRMKIARSAMAS